MTPPRMCHGCGGKPQAYHGRGLCYDCKPGSKGRPRPCRRCRSKEDYWTEGLCRRCHQYAPQLPEPCRDCYAWGVKRRDKWLCGACCGWRVWQSRTGTCVSCRREQTINEHQACRLCWTQTKRFLRPDEPIDVIAANQFGQQLMLADMSSSKNGYRQHPRRRNRWNDTYPDPLKKAPAGHPECAGQLNLFAREPIVDSARRYGFPDPPDIRLADRLDALTLEHGRRYGWRDGLVRETRVAIRVVLGMRDNPMPPIQVSEVARLGKLGLPVRPVCAVFSDAGVLEDDRPPTIQLWFERNTGGLPAPMRSELGVWFDVLHNGSTTPPRCRPRSPATIKSRLLWTLPTLRDWAGQGHQSLREITREHILAVLPTAGTPRAKLGGGLRSILRTLKARKVIFVNPLAGMRIGNFERRTPLPVKTANVRAALASPEPTTAALVALMAFHGLRPVELRDLHLTDVRDGRLQLPDRTVMLADPVKTRLAAYLDHRNTKWPNSINPYFFINQYTALDTGPAHRGWINKRLGISPQALRQDRILDEAIATNGDLRRICDLFGVTIATALHYATVLDNPDLVAAPIPATTTSSGTGGPT